MTEVVLPKFLERETLLLNSSKGTFNKVYGHLRKISKENSNFR